MDTKDDEGCIARFSHKKRIWIGIALPTALILLTSIFATARGNTSWALQLGGLAMLAAFALATAVLCRCPRCRRFQYDQQSMTPGWTLQRCPHCQAPLQEH